MKTFFYYIKQRRVRAWTLSKAIVVAEDQDKALELVKNYYPLQFKAGVQTLSTCYRKKSLATP